MSLYSGHERTLEAIFKIADLDLRHSCLYDFLNDFEKDNNNEDAAKIIKKTERHIKQTLEIINMPKNGTKDSNAINYEYKVTTAQNIRNLSSTNIPIVIKAISELPNVQHRFLEYSILLPFCQDQDDINNVKDRISHAKSEIEKYELKKTSFIGKKTCKPIQHLANTKLSTADESTQDTLFNSFLGNIENLMENFKSIADPTCYYDEASFYYDEALVKIYKDLRKKIDLFLNINHANRKHFADYFLSTIEEIEYKFDYESSKTAHKILTKNKISLNSFYLPQFDETEHAHIYQQYILYDNLSNKLHSENNIDDELLKTHRSFISCISEHYISEIKSHLESFISESKITRKTNIDSEDTSNDSDKKNDIYDKLIKSSLIEFDSTELKTKTTSYLNTKDFSFEEESINIYNSIARSFKTDNLGFIDDKPIYCLWLAVFLNDKNVLVKHNSKDKENRIVGTAYKKSYVDGFNDGLTYFDKKYNVSFDNLLTNHDTVYNILSRQYNTGFCDFGHLSQGEYGWKVVCKIKYDFYISPRTINRFGYYSAMVFKMKQLKIDYPPFFDNIIEDNNNRKEILKTEQISHPSGNSNNQRWSCGPARAILDENQNKTAIIHTFDSFFKTETQTYILEILEDLAITQDGKYALSDRKKSALKGVVVALIEKNMISNLGVHNLVNMIAVKIKLDLNSKLGNGFTFDDYKKKAEQYIKAYPLQEKQY